MTASAMPARDRQPRSSSILTWRKTSAVGSSIVTKVLYIEDNDDNVYMLKMRLELLGDFEVLTAKDGEKGCEMAAAERPDIILMDLEMPVVDGWEATRRLRGDPQTRETPLSPCPRMRWSASAKRRSRQGAMSSTPSRSNSIDWSQPFGAFSPTANDGDLRLQVLAKFPSSPVSVAMHDPLASHHSKSASASGVGG